MFEDSLYGIVGLHLKMLYVCYWGPVLDPDVELIWLKRTVHLLLMVVIRIPQHRIKNWVLIRRNARTRPLAYIYSLIAILGLLENILLTCYCIHC